MATEAAARGASETRWSVGIAGLRRTFAGVVYRAHVWLGLLTAVGVIVISLTGIYLNHREGLGLWSPPEDAGGSIESALPIRQLFILGITGAHDAGLPVKTTVEVQRLTYRPGPNTAAVRLKDARVTEILLHAGTGEVIEVAPRDDVRVEHVHSGEVLGQQGVIVGDIIAGALILLTLGGVYLWLNRARSSWRQDEALRTRGRSWVTLNRRLHLVGGLAVGAAVVWISVTGILLNHKREFGYMVEPFRAFDYELHRVEPMQLADIADRAVLAVPERGFELPDDVRWIDFRPDVGYAKVRFADKAETEVILDPFDGDVISVAERRDIYMERLHSGAFIGANMTILSDITAAVLIVLTLNGLYLWVWPVWLSRSRESERVKTNAQDGW
jgi:hypothetical protein